MRRLSCVQVIPPSPGFSMFASRLNGTLRLRSGSSAFLLIILIALAGCGEVSGPDVRPAVSPERTVVATAQVAAGGFHTCALRSTGVIQCWGNNAANQAPASQSASAGTFTGIMTGFAHTCGLRSDGVVECFGLNSSSQAPATVSASAGTFVQMANSGTATDYSCALRSDGAFECWGTNSSGFAPAVRTAAVGTFTQVSISNGQECGLRSDGAVECWYFNSVLQHQVTTASAGVFTQVATGIPHTCALTSLGTVECWGGSNSFGQAPATWSAATGSFTAVSTGFQDTCALRSDGVIQCIGDNSTGAAPATRNAIGATYTQVSLGYQQSCGQVSTGLVECWGSNSDGQAMSEQRITFTSPAPHAVNVGGSFVVTATASSGDAVAFSSLTTGVCTVSTGTVTVNGEGACTIAADQAGNANFFAAAQVTQTTSFIAAPANVLTTSSDLATIDVAWTDASGIEGLFKIQRRIRNGDGSWNSWLQIASVAPNTVAYHDAAVTSGLSYQYRVQACHTTLCSTWATGAVLILQTKPVAPTNLSLTAAAPTQVDLAWSDASSNETRFEVVRRTQTLDRKWGNWILIVTLPANSVAYSDAAASAIRPVQYEIRACNSAGCSAWLISAAISTQQPPAAPGSLVATAASSTEIDLSWIDNSTTETYFELQRRTRVAGVWNTWTPAANPSADATTAADFSAATVTTYDYHIRACNLVGCSAWVLSRAVTTP